MITAKTLDKIPFDGVLRLYKESSGDLENILHHYLLGLAPKGRQGKTSKETSDTPKRRNLSAAARKRIADAQKRRWAKAREEKAAMAALQAEEAEAAPPSPKKRRASKKK